VLSFDQQANLNLENLHLEQLTYHPGNHPYQFVVGAIKSNQTGKLALRNIEVHPTLSKDQVTKFYRFEKNQFTITTERVDLHVEQSWDTQLTSLIPSNDDHPMPVIRINSIQVIKPQIAIYRDNRRPFPPNHYGFWPLKSMQSLGFPLSVDSVIIRGGAITHQQMEPQVNQLATLPFSHLNADLYNFRLGLNHQESAVNGHISTHLYENTTINLHLDLPYDHPREEHRIWGTITSLDLKQLNSYLDPVMHAFVQRGHMDSLNYDLRLDQDQASGSVYVDYQDLKVALRSSSNDHRGSNHARIKSLLANTVLIRSNAADSGQVSVKRDRTRSIFHYWGEALLSGFTDIIRK
jgi:hypothetical protein